jgi:hypothetical protein
VRGGGSFGITSRGFDPSALIYDSQWNGMSFDPTLSTNEIYATTARVYPSIAMSVFMQKQEERFLWNLGYSVNNITRPKQSFKDNNAVVLDMRHAIQASARIPLNDQYEVEALTLFQRQGKMKELVLGSRAYYKLPSEKWENQRVFAGVHGRFRDAAWIELGAEYNEWRVGISYDLSSIFKNDAAVKLAESKLTEIKNSEAMLTDYIKIEVQKAIEDYHLAIQQNEVYAESVAQSSENYRIIKDKYDNGLANTNDLLEADVEQLSANINKTLAKANIIQKYYALLNATGQLTATFTISKL